MPCVQPSKSSVIIVHSLRGSSNYYFRVISYDHRGTRRLVIGLVVKGGDSQYLRGREFEPQCCIFMFKENSLQMCTCEHDSTSYQQNQLGLDL